MDLRTLKYFITVAEELNITRAASILNMSQPPLSNQIKGLEEELGTVLFIRGKRQLELTDSGKLLYRRAKEIISLSEKAGAEILSMSKGMTGTISLGVVEGIAPEISAKWIKGFISEHPMVNFRITDGNSDDLTEDLRSGLISLAVITAPYDQLLLNSFNVGTSKMIALINKDNHLAKSKTKSIKIADLKDEPLIIPGRKSNSENIYRWFREIKSEPQIVCETDSYLDALALVKSNVGISIFPESFNPPESNLIIKQISGTKPVDYLFVWRKGHPLPTVEEAFIDYVRASLEDL